MSRYQTLTFSRAVAAGDTAMFALTVPYNRVNVSKIRITPTDASENWSFSIHKDGGYTTASLVYGTVTFAGNLVDPVYADGVSVAEKNQGFVCAYEDDTQSLQMYLKIVNSGAVAQTFTGEIEVDTVYGLGVTVTDVPSGLLAKAYATNLKITSGVIATKNNASIVMGEFRAIFVSGTTDRPYYDLRTVAEGGTFVHNGTTQIIANVDSANSDGAQYIFTSASAGRWYYAWRLQNSVGWSNWSDGNEDPVRVTQYVDTRSNTTPDSGPPADWDVWIEDGPATGTLVVHATRPATNGDVINWMGAQILDTAGGTWVTLLAGSDPGHLKLDGRSNSFSLNPTTRNQITDDDSIGWGTAAIGDLVLLDVRGGGATWNEQYCQWATIRSIGGTSITINGFFRPQSYTDMRLIIIKPPWAWTTNGFGVGMWPQKKSDENLFVGDTKTREFITTAISVPSSMTSPEARVWFENDYSRADNNLTHSTGKAGFQTVRTFEDFIDSRYWIPIYITPRWQSLTLDSVTRHATVAAVTPRDSTYTHYGTIIGMKGRFRVFPDLSGVIKVRARFENVYIPQYAGADTSDDSCIVLGWQDKHNYWSTNLYTLVLGNYQKLSDLYLFCGNIYGSDQLSLGSHSGILPTWANYIPVTRPAAGYTADMRLGFSTGTVSNDYGVTTAEVSFNGGAYTSITGIGRGGIIDAADIQMYGFQPFLLFFESYHPATRCLPEWRATMTQFEVEQGIIVPGRIMSGKA
jgi:hypothetical protein